MKQKTILFLLLLLNFNFSSIAQEGINDSLKTSLAKSGKVSPDLKGRQLLKKIAGLTDTSFDGIVVIEIIVDETGKVIRASPEKQGTTTTKATLLAKARQASLLARFSVSPEGLKEQRGTLTFVFTLE